MMNAVPSGAGAIQLLASSIILATTHTMRLSLHPDGLAPRIANLASWRDHLLERLLRQIEASADRVLGELLEELRGYPVARASRLMQPEGVSAHPAVFVPLELATPHGTLCFISTTTVFGTPVDVTVAELALECFFPADEQTATTLRRIAEAGDQLTG